MGPASIAQTSVGATAAGGVVSAISSILGGESQAGMFKYQAGVAQLNERIAKQNADWSRAAGVVERQQAGMESRFKIGTTKVAQAAGGFDVNAGTNVIVRESEGEVGRHNQDLITSNAAKRAYGFDLEAVKEKAQAGVYEAGAEKAEMAGGIGAVSSILGSASSVASKWLQYGPAFGNSGPSYSGAFLPREGG